MITRSIDGNNDWNFGRGKQDYLQENAALAQNIKTRLQSFYQDCFFAPTEGIDWFTFLGSKNRDGLKNAVSKVILNTVGVYSVDEVNFNLDENRQLLIEYVVTSLWSETVSAYATIG